MKRTILGILAAAFLVAATSTPAKADTLCSQSLLSTDTSCSIDFTVANISNFPEGPPYGTVALTLSGGDIVFDIDMASNFGIHNAGFGFNYNGSQGALSDVGGCTVVSPNPATTCTGPNNGGAFDGFGTFSNGYEIAGNQGQANDPTSMTFTISAANGNLILTDVINGSITGHKLNDANWFAVQIAYIPNSGCTGFAGNAGSVNASSPNENCGGTPVPEPGSLMLFGTGLLGIAGFLRRKLLG